MNNVLANAQAFAEGLILDGGYLPNIFEVMLEAWTQVSIPHKKTLEPRITALWKVQCCIVNQKRYSDVGPQFDFFYEVQEPDPITGRQISRKDIVVNVYDRCSCNTIKRRAPYLIVESKKLTNSGDISKYVGIEGMLCFITCKYDPFQSHVAMAAYVMSDEIDKFKNDVLKRIDNLSDHLKTIATYPSWTILPDHPRHSSTRHLIGNKPIYIHHLFLEADNRSKKDENGRQ